MGSIALLARDLGMHVTGADENVYPPMSTQLQAAGIKLASGYDAESLPECADLVIIGNANLPRGIPAVEAVLDSGIPYTSGAEFLARYLLQDRWVIAVAGTHGKTTTAAMISLILEEAGLNPGFLIGGIPLNFSRSSKLGADPFFVIEADEYDTSYFDRRSKFLHYRPRTLVLNNLEYDHADIFPDLEAIKQQFHLLLRSVPRNGLIIHPRRDKNLDDIIGRGCWSETLQIGGDACHAELSVKDGSAFSVIFKGEKQGEVAWQLTGEHNVANALAAIMASRNAGVAPSVACEALCNFRGVKRRMETIYSHDDITVYDDFAHHPTAISTTLAGLRNKVGEEKILAVIEPASHTMRQGTHEATLGKSVDVADHTIWFKPASVGWDMSPLGRGNATLINDIDKLAATVEARSKSLGKPLHIVIMSNGGFMGVHQKIVNRLGGNERNRSV